MSPLFGACACAVAAALVAVEAAMAARGAETSAAHDRSAVDESLARAFRDMRTAEVAGDLDGIERARAEVAGTASAGALVDERAALARAAITARSGANAQAEDELATQRRALAMRAATVDAAVARELLLECAEDLLLRRLAVDGTDVALAVGMPTDREREAARGVVARVDELLRADAMRTLFAADAPLATDGAVFRARLLAGLARVVEMDLVAAEARPGGAVAGASAHRLADTSVETSGAARARASASLDEAARSELPLPSEIGAILALARVRAGCADRSMQERLLAQAQTADDAMRAFVARVEAWRRDDAARGGDAAAFPAVMSRDGRRGASTGSGALAAVILGATAEARARLERGENADRVSAPFARALRECVDGADRAQSLARLRRVAAALAMRLDGPTRMLARADGAPPLLRALAACSPAEPTLLAEQAARLSAFARDPIAAPWLAVPLARVLREQGQTREAVGILVDLVDGAPEVEGAGDAIEIALALARVEAARSSEGEVALDRALDVAARHAGTAALRDERVLERVDLALFLQHTAAHAARAAEILQGVSTRTEVRDARDVRALEIDALRAGSAAAAAGAVAERATIVIDGLSGARSMPSLAARAEAVRAAMLLASGRPAEAAADAVRVLEEPSADERVVLRAATVWMSAATERDDAVALPAALRALLAREPARVERVLPAIEPAIMRARDRVELALVEGDAARARRESERRLLVLATALADAAPAEPSLAESAVLAELAAGRIDAAVTRAERLLQDLARTRTGASEPPADEARRATWLLAESLRARGADGADADARARAFSLLRELSPLGAAERDPVWWRAQLGQLEILSDDAARVGDIRARMNRLTAIDPALGGKTLSKRFTVLRARIENEAPRRKDGTP